MDVKRDRKSANYNFDDYRSEINGIIERNKKRIKITEVLRDCGISKGNYYVFMNGGREYKDGTVSTLSYAKLDSLLSTLRKLDAFATNRKRLETLSDKELAEFIEKKIINDPKAKRIDVLKWLKSSDREIIYKK